MEAISPVGLNYRHVVWLQVYNMAEEATVSSEVLHVAWRRDLE